MAGRAGGTHAPQEPGADSLGDDPVAALSERLDGLINTAMQEKEVGVVAEIKDQAGALADGTAKYCRKCGQVRSKDAFRDQRLKGGYGQICASCKRSARVGGRVRGWRYRRRW